LKPAVVRIAWRTANGCGTATPVFGWGVAEPARWETGSMSFEVGYSQSF
jgi:hypothetical protein